MPRISQSKPSEFLRTSEVAAALGISIDSVLDAAKRGDLPAYKIGRRYRFDPVDVENYVKPVSPQRDSSEAVAR